MAYRIKRQDLSAFARKLADQLQDGDVVCINGDLGAGKTTLVQEIGSYWGVEGVTSPTFALIADHSGDRHFYHMDFYRLEDPEEIETLDYETYFYPEGISFIEWSERVADYLPPDVIQVDIGLVNEETRDFSIRPDSPRARAILEGIQ